MTLYASTAVIKAALRITDNVDDSLIATAGSAASELIDAYCGRTFGAGTVASTRYFAARKANHVEVDDMASAPVFVKSSSNRDGNYDTDWASTDLAYLPTNQFVDGLSWPYTAIQTLNMKVWPISYSDEPTIAVSAIWGFPTVPASVVQAAVIQSTRIFKRLDSPLGVAGFGDAGVMRVHSKVDPDVEVLLQPYRRIRAAL